jgi:hypothetical protein
MVSATPIAGSHVAIGSTPARPQGSRRTAGSLSSPAVPDDRQTAKLRPKHASMKAPPNWRSGRIATVGRTAGTSRIAGVQRRLAMRTISPKRFITTDPPGPSGHVALQLEAPEAGAGLLTSHLRRERDAGVLPMPRSASETPWRSVMALMGGGGRPFSVSMVAATDSSRRGNGDRRRWRVRWPGFSFLRGAYDRGERPPACR